MTSQWIQSHCNIIGNEIAEAKEASKLNPIPNERTSLGIAIKHIYNAFTENGHPETQKENTSQSKMELMK